jgi:hypothetical protein
VTVDEMIARHQTVREFVEQRYPGRKVMEITERARTKYAWSFDGRHVLAGADVKFDVEMHTTALTSKEPSVRCELAMLEDGSLRVVSEQFEFFR